MMGRPRKFNDDDVRLMRGMLDIGLTYPDVGKAFGCSAATARRYVNDDHERINCQMQDHYVRSEEYRDGMRARAAAAKICVHFPEGQTRIPLNLLRRLRQKCLDMGGDPGSRPDLVMAGLELLIDLDPDGDEAIWLHPEDLEIRCAKWADRYRRRMKI